MQDMAELRDVFQENVRRRLRELGLTQREFAKMLGVTEQFVSELLNRADYSPRLPTVDKIAKALDINSLSLLLPLESEESAKIAANSP